MVGWGLVLFQLECLLLIYNELFLKIKCVSILCLLLSFCCKVYVTIEKVEVRFLEEHLNHVTYLRCRHAC